MIRFARIPSPLGSLRVVADEKGLISLSMPTSKDIDATGSDWVEDRAFFGAAEAALKEFFKQKKPLARLPKGKRPGTAFQRKVWAAIEKIPFGETRSYGQIAESIGAPGAARAVGSACGANPLPLFVPCHRVLAAGNKIGGFGCGLDVKKKLLRIEGISWAGAQ